MDAYVSGHGLVLRVGQGGVVDVDLSHMQSRRVVEVLCD